MCLHGELSAGKYNFGRPQLRYQDVCKRDMTELNIGLNKMEGMVMDHSKWRSYLQLQVTLKVDEKDITTALEKQKRKLKEEK